MTIKLCTFNIRLGVVDDGDHHWDKRKALLAETVGEIDPDVLCVQEAYRFQVDFLREQLPQHHVYGVGREDGVDQGEHAAIFYRGLTGRETSTIWLSETPDVPGSRSWESRCTRIASFVSFSEGFTVCNTHWDHVSEWARDESAKVIRQQLDGSFFVCGDFNASPDSGSIKTLEVGLVRASGSPGGTFHGFSGVAEGDAIDHIFATPDWKLVSTHTVTTGGPTLWPSDHFPVVATFVRSDSGTL